MKRWPVCGQVAVDCVIIAICLGLFYYAFYIIPQKGESANIIIENNVSSQGEAVPWKEKFTEKFTEETISTESTYTSPNISITLEKATSGEENEKITYFVADVYIADIEFLQTYLAENTYGTGYAETVPDMDAETGALLAINGDYYGDSGSGTVIRNGVLYRSNRSNSDVCVLYRNGELETYSPDTFDVEEAISNKAYQAWTFGPALLDSDGNAISQFNTSRRISSDNPRTAIGYYEPGHYCFVLVDGREEGYSKGMALEELSQLFHSLGCTAAYNLDGGKSSIMTFHDAVVNNPVDGGRKVSDCVLIKEATGNESA